MKLTPNKWTFLVFYPKINTPVCETELVAYSKVAEELEKRDTELFFCTNAAPERHLMFYQRVVEFWNQAEHSFYEDTCNRVLKSFGAFGFDNQPQRLTIILDEKQKVRYKEIISFEVGRNPKEHIRILDALQTGELCGACREEGEQTLGVLNEL